MTAPSPLLIFLSCGTPHDKSQEDFIAAVEAHLASHNCKPQTVGRSVYSARQPVEAARDLIETCHGAVVIAFERTRIVSGFERPGSPQQKIIQNESHPTIWNQMEAAMAYAQKIPILSLVQTGLKRQGMLSDRFEWSAIEDDLNPVLLATEKFRQTFSEWIVLVRKASEKIEEAAIDPEQLKVGTLVKQLSAKQVISLSLVTLGAVGSIISIAFNAGLSWREFTDGRPGTPKAMIFQPQSPNNKTPWQSPCDKCSTITS
jgi:hypothetical protein